MRALARLIKERRLPITVDELLEIAYQHGQGGDPYLGYRDFIKPATERELDTARDPRAALLKRLDGQNAIRELG